MSEKWGLRCSNAIDNDMIDDDGVSYLFPRVIRTGMKILGPDNDSKIQTEI